MTQDQIIEINRKIALFMGYKENGECITHPEFGTYTKKGLSLLKYHDSYEWLMPVVEEINKYDWVTINADECKIHSLNVGAFDNFITISDGDYCDLYNIIYKTVSKYINWWYKNKYKK